MKTLRMAIIGKKLGMTQIFDEGGLAVPVTVVQAGPCAVVQKKVQEKEGYNALQLGFEETTEKKVTKPLQGHFKKSNCPPYRVLREVRLPVEEMKQFEVGHTVKVDFFSTGDFIDVTGTSKGKGYAGVIKRHHFSGFPASHGTHEVKRHGGSIGQSSSPSRVFKGMRMAGQMGSAQKTVQHLRVVKVLEDKNILLIKGAVPGANGSYLLIKKSIKKPSKAPEKKGGN
jgi:large subunit ribosomal protein L3